MDASRTKQLDFPWRPPQLGTGCAVAVQPVPTPGAQKPAGSRTSATPPAPSAGLDQKSLPHPIQGFGQKRVDGLFAPSAGDIDNTLQGQGVKAATGAYDRGRIDVSADPSADGRGFLLRVDSFHTAPGDRVTLTLQARVQDGPKEGIITLAVLADADTLNSQGFEASRTFRVDYKDLDAYLAKLNPNLRLAPGSQLAVAAKWQNGHQWGGFSRGGSFYVPNAKPTLSPLDVRQSGAASSAPSLPLDVSVKLPKVIIDKYPEVFAPGAAVTTRLESELKGETDPAAVEAAIVSLYKLSQDPKAVASLLGPGWVIEPVQRFFRKDSAGTATISPRLAALTKNDPSLAGVTLGDPDPLVDIYKDTARLELLSEQIVYRVRSNAQKAGMLNFKPGPGRLDPTTGIRRRLEVGMDLAPGASDGHVAAFLDFDLSAFNVARRELARGGTNLPPERKFLDTQDVLEVTAERHRFVAKNTDPKSPDFGVEVEMTADFTHGKTLLRQHAKSGVPRTASLAGFEAELDHVAISSKHEVQGTAPATALKIFFDESDQATWAKGLSAQATTASAPRFHSQKDLDDRSIIDSPSQQAFAAVLAKLTPVLFPKGLSPSKQKATRLLELMGLVRATSS